MEEDKRFEKIPKDPRFRHMPLKHRKLKVDDRFKGMFKDQRFKVKYTVDKRGRPINLSTDDHLHRYYQLSDSDDEDAGESGSGKAENEVEKVEKKKKKKKEKKKRMEAEVKVADAEEGEEVAVEQREEMKEAEKVDEDGDEEESEDDDEEDDSSEDLDLARGDGNIETSSDEDDEPGEEEDADVEADVAHAWGELNAVPVGEETSRRLAICNMDWDRMKAVDLFVLFNSFKPQTGVIHSVTIYPSEYGIQRMEEEEVHGPNELIGLELPEEEEKEEPTEKEDDEEREAEKREGDADPRENRDDTSLEGSQYHREKLRQYQLNRLKYYYAVLECDTAETAAKIYEECDGLEYESSSTKFDLRFIPDAMEFDHKPKDRTTSMPDATAYKPSLFFNSALNQTKVECTWDETPRDRLAVTTRKFNSDEIQDLDVSAYLASSSEEDEGTSAQQEQLDGSESSQSALDAIEKYRALLKGLDDDDEKEKKGEFEMEVTWEPGLKKATEKMVKKSEDKRLTPAELYLKKRREKKMRKNETKESTKGDAGEGGAFSDDELPDGVDLNDPYYQEERGEAAGGKKRDKKQRRGQQELSEEEKKSRAELELLLMEDKGDNRRHFNLKEMIQSDKSKKRKKRKHLPEEETEAVHDDFKVNVNDPRFSAIFTSHHYNIDPSDPHFKRTKGMDEIVKVKQSRKDVPTVSAESQAPSQGQSSQQLDPQLNSLVRSIKNKTELLKTKNKGDKSKAARPFSATR